MIKKWFTLIELIMVIGIILTLIVTFNNIFVNTNKDFLYVETCINKIHWDMNNFIYSAITSKWLYVWTWTIFPQQYTISIIPEKEIILLYENYDNTTWIYLSNDLSSTILANDYCSTNKYITKLSWNRVDIAINKSSLDDQTLPTFTINNWSEIFSEITKMYLCYVENNDCKEIANFIIDIRTQNIQKKKCTLINKEGIDCLKRDQ